MQANIGDVAQRAKVSSATVSRAFKHPELVAEATREHIIQAADELDFAVSRSAAVFQTGQTFRIALLLNDPSSTWFNAHVYEGLDSVLHPAGYDIAIYPIGTSDDRHVFFENLPIRRNADAVVIASFDVDSKEIERLHSMNVPIIGISALPEEVFDYSIATDDDYAMRLVTRHLLTLGHRDIGYISLDPPENADGSLHYSANRRSNGFLAECAEAHIEPAMLHVPNTSQRVEHALTQLFALDHMPTATCCEQDRLAVPLLSRLQRLGYAIPDALSVTGFDDSTYASEVGLTTVRQDPRDMGARAARHTLGLIARIDDDSEDGAERNNDRGETNDETSGETNNKNNKTDKTPPIHESTQIRMMFRLSTGPAPNAV